MTQELATKGDVSRPSPVKSFHTETHGKITKTISDIITFITASNSGPKVLLIEGAPGMGKTVLSKEIAFQWANDKLLSSLNLLLLVFLRNFHSSNIKSVEGFMQHVFKNGKVANDVVEYVFKNDGKDLAIVLDGYDEMSEKDRIHSFITDIIKRVVFPQCLLVITSRPTASSHLHSIANCRVEIIGFTEEDRLEYIKAAMPDSSEKVETLQLYLQSNPTINALCYIPLNMTILLCLSVTGVKNLPKTQTELYKRFIEMTVVRFLQKQDANLNAMTLDLYKLPYPHNKVFEELSHFAFKALQNDKMVFTFTELKASCPNLTSNNLNGLGLLKSVKYFDYINSKEDLTCHFLHFSIQEYMAAYYISKLSDSEQIKLLQNTFWTIRYYNTWIMYVGITSGESFPLKHFFSGNWFKIFTWLAKSPGISKKLTNDKIKCLHMFQCLAETENHDLISAVGKCFRNQEIDLSHQTLLPNHLDTLGFFLIRSVCKHWRMLNLSHCSIGSIGCSRLSEKLSNKISNHSLVSVERIDLSCNQLNLESLVKLFDIFKCWNVSELIITDNAILQSISSSQLYSEIEHNFIQTTKETTTLKLACIGPFLFAYKVHHEKIKAFLSSLPLSMESMYLLNCDMKFCISEQGFLGMQEVMNIHCLDTVVNATTFCNILCINNTVNHLLIYDSMLPDSAADEICDLILSMEKPHSIMLIISKYKVQGIINTSSVCNNFSDLEILNIILKIRSLCSNYVSPATVWRKDLQFYSDKTESITQSFVKFLCHYALVCRLRIKLTEENTFIAHKIEYKDIINGVTGNQSLSSIYLSDCSLSNHEYEKLANSINHRLSSLIILNVHFNFNLSFNTLFKPLLHINGLRYIFLHTTSSYLNEYDSFVAIPANCNISMVLLTRDVLVVHNPTSEQLSLTYQLESSYTRWKFFYCQFDAETFYLILTMLGASEKVWIELDFTGCNIGHIDYEIAHKFIQANDNMLKINKLIIPAYNYQLTDISSNLCALTKLIICLNTKELVISDCSNAFYNHLTKNLQETFILNCRQASVVLSVLSTSRKTCFFCNTDWKKITSSVNEDVTSLFVINSNLSSLTKDETILIFSKTPVLSQMTIINDALPEIAFFDVFMNKQIELSIFITMADRYKCEASLYSITEISRLYNARYNVIAATKNAVCGYNITQQQLLLLKSITKLYCTHNVTTLIQKIKLKLERILFIIQMHQLRAIYFINDVSQATDATNLASVLEGVSTVTTFGIINYTINQESTSIFSDMIKSNNKLEKLYLNGCFQNNDSLMAILKLLMGFSTLRVLEIANNNITSKEADDMAAIVACNSKLQVLNLNGNNLQTAGIAKIAKSLRHTSTLTKLFISNNNISEEAAGDIAQVLLCSPNLQEVDLSNNYFLSIGVVKIAKALYGISTLNALNLSNNKITKEATDAIAAILSCNHNLRKLYLDESAIQMQKIAKYLRHTFTLTELNISNNITVKEAASSIAEVLSHNTQLEKLNLNGNNLQAEGIIAVAKGLQSTPHVRTLELAYSNFSEQAADNIADALSYNTQLCKLNLNGSSIQASSITRIMGALSKLSSLTELYFDQIYVTDSAACSVAAALSHNPNLRVLSLSGNNLQVTGISQIIRSLNRISTLNELYINSNDITKEAANNVAALILHNKSLQKLELDNNSLKDKGVKKIASALLHLKTLTHLSLSYNSITDNAAGDIAAALSHNTKLQVLRLNGNNLQTEGVKLITNSLQHVFTLEDLQMAYCNCTKEAADYIATVLSHNMKLKALNLGGNDLQANGISIIARALVNTYTLQSLKIENNNCTEEAANDLATILSRNTNIQVIDCSRNNLKSKGINSVMKSLKNIFDLHSLLMEYNNCKEEAVDDIAAVISHNIKLHTLYLGGNNLGTKGAIIILQSLVNVSSLKRLYFENNNITTEAADNMAAVLSCNTELQEVVLSKNDLQGEGVAKIARALQNISSLMKLAIDNNNVTKEAADDIAAVISCNTELRKLDLSWNILQIIGAQKIARNLTNISTLTELRINNNEINLINDHDEEIGDDLAAVVSCNKHLKVLDLTRNFLTTRGVIKIAKALQKNKDLLSLK